MPALEDSPVRRGEQAVREESYDPGSLLLPVVRTAVEHIIQHRDISCIQCRSLEKEPSGQWIDEAGRVEHPAEGVKEEKRCIRRQLHNRVARWGWNGILEDGKDIHNMWSFLHIRILVPQGFSKQNKT